MTSSYRKLRYFIFLFTYIKYAITKQILIAEAYCDISSNFMII